MKIAMKILIESILPDLPKSETKYDKPNAKVHAEYLISIRIGLDKLRKRLKELHPAKPK